MSKNSNLDDDLLNLMNELNGTTASPAKKQVDPNDDLDALMNDLSHLSAPKPGTGQRPANKYNTLMNDLNPDAEKKPASKAPTRQVGGPKKPTANDDNDLDSLVNELSALEDKGKKPASKASVDEDLDALMSSLAAGPSPSQKPTQSSGGVDDLDDLMTALAGGSMPAVPSKPSVQPANKGGVKKPASKNDDEDLDALMSSLASQPASKPAPSKAKPSAADNDDLDALMSSLAGTPSKPAQTKPPVQQQPVKQQPKPADNDDLEFLMNSLAGGQSTTAPSKPAAKPASKPEDDDLEALMSSLQGGTGAKSPPQQSRPTQQPAARNAPSKATVAADEDLESLMRSLSGGPVARQPPAQQPADDLESLMTALQGPASRSQPVARPQAAQSDDLESLMNSLTGPSQPPKSQAKQEEEDLETLMTSLSVGQKRTMNVGRPPQKISEKPSQNTASAFLADDAGDLDSLMNQLSSKPAQSAGSTSELDSLMNELGGPAHGDLNSLLGALGGGSTRPMGQNPMMMGQNPMMGNPMMNAMMMQNPMMQNQFMMHGMNPMQGGMNPMMMGMNPMQQQQMMMMQGQMGMNPMMMPQQNKMVVNASTPQPAQPSPVKQPETKKDKVNSDLDDILSGLDDNIAKTPSPSEPVKKPAPAPIENLPKGCCAGCRKFIVGEVTTAMGRSYHPDHFVCSSCSTVIGTQPYFEKDRLPQCTKCYQQHFCPKCARCDKPITSQQTTAIGKKWHTACFTCKGCLSKLGQQFYEHGGQPYCITCYKSVQAVSCKACGEAISGQNINALNSYWHPEHFCCQMCKITFPTGQFYQHNGFPYCPTHYMQMQQMMMMQGGGGMQPGGM